MQDLHVVLGCFGLRNEDFVSCSGIENVILKVDPSVNRYNDMMDYFECCRLFDKPLLEFNAIRHFVYNLQDRFDQVNKRLWSPKKFELYQKFVIDHRHCGLIVKLEIPQTNDSSAVVMEPSSGEEKVLKVSGNKLRLIRGQ